MLGDHNKNVRSVGVLKVLAHRKQVAEKSANNDDCPHVLNSSLICLCDVPTPGIPRSWKNLENPGKIYFPGKSWKSLGKLAKS